MAWPGLVGTISMVAGLLLALPMVVIGIELLVDGRTALGLGMLGIAAALLVLPEYVVRRLPRPWRRLTRAD